VDAQSFRAGIGALLTLCCHLMLFSARLPHLRLRHARADRLADGLAGACGGLTGPLGGFTGAIPTLWCTLKGLERDAQRTIIQNFKLALLAVTLASYLASGIVTAPMWPLMAVVLQALALPALLAPASQSLDGLRRRARPQASRRQAGADLASASLWR